jgi:hypothetical protein
MTHYREHANIKPLVSKVSLPFKGRWLISSLPWRRLQQVSVTWNEISHVKHHIKKVFAQQPPLSDVLEEGENKHTSLVHAQPDYIQVSRSRRL